MATVTVWSERNDPNSPGGSWRDCAYSSALMALVFAGFTKFPAGLYTVAEREALERSDDQPDETGASLDDIVVAVKRRYGIDWHTSGISYLSQYPARVDLGFVITGANGNLPAGHTLRRWDAAFTGGHAVFITPTGDGTHVKWYDPEAPMGFAGDTTDWATVRKWMGASASFILVKRDAYAPPPPAPLLYTEAQMTAVKNQLQAAQQQVVNLTQVNRDQKVALDAATAKITAAKTALG